MGRRWMRVGYGCDDEVRTSARTAVETAMDGSDPRLLLVFGSAGQSPDEISEAVTKAADGVPYLGCSTSGHIGSTERPDDGVLVIGLGGDLAVETACRTDLNARPRQAGVEIATALRQAHGERQAILMLLANLDGDQQELIRGAYSVLGADAPLTGAVAGGGLPSADTWQLFDGTVVDNAVTAASLSGPPIGVAVKHGWRGSGDGLTATASDGNHVYTLDDRPALDVYLERNQAPPGIADEPRAFGAFALTRPLAMARRGEVAVRHVVRANPRSGSLYCAAAVPRGAAVWIGTTDLDATLTATEQVVSEAVAQLNGAPVEGVIVFDCAGRRAVLEGAGVQEEWRRIRAQAGNAPVAGFYGNGEIARVHGANGVHNQTIVACAIG